MEIRKAVLTDAKGIAKVHVDSWKTTYATIIPDKYLNSLSYNQREQLWENNISNGGVFVAEDEDGRVVGFSSGGMERTGKYPDYQGELYAIYILQEFQGNGLGKLLLKPIIEGLQQQNIISMLVLVLEDNSSRFFYEALGGEKIASIGVEFSGKRLNELVYGWSDSRTMLER